MASINTVTTPLLLTFPDGNKLIAAAYFSHQMGLLYLDLFWHLKTPDDAAHLIHGELQGEGPWKIDGVVIRIVGCHGTDPEVQDQVSQWQNYLNENLEVYPGRQQMIEIVKRLGAISNQ